MKKQTIDFGTSTTYKAPKCKCVELRIQSILCNSFGDGSKTNPLDDDEEEDEPYFNFNL